MMRRGVGLALVAVVMSGSMSLAADPVLTSLDMCDSLGLSGLTISSDSNCLQITGSVSYRFQFGDFTNDATGAGKPVAGPFSLQQNGNVEIPDGDGIPDWQSRIVTLLGVTATAETEFGPAAAHIVLKHHGEPQFYGNAFSLGRSDSAGLIVDEAWVSVGDSTVITAGLKGTIANFGSDEPYNFLGLFNSSALEDDVDDDEPARVGRTSVGGAGVFFNGPFVAGDNNVDLAFGGAVIQVATDFGNGFYARAGLENIGDDTNPTGDPDRLPGSRAGTLVGVLGYDGDAVSAHVTGAAGGVLDGIVDWLAFHAGAEVKLDNVSVLGALAGSTNLATGISLLNGLASATASFDMFTIAASGEFVTSNGAPTSIGAGASIGVTPVDNVTLNAGFRWFDADIAAGGDEAAQLAVQAVYGVTETLALTGEVGVVLAAANFTGDVNPYGALELAWSPGGDFTASVKGEAYLTDATPGFRAEFNAAKSFN